MSEDTPQMPRKFAFDEFYEMIKEFVNDPEAREALTTYDAEFGAGRGYLKDSSQCSELAFEAHGKFKAIGWSILVKHGWPTYWQVVHIKDVEMQSKIISMGSEFISICRRVFRKEPHERGWYFQDEHVDLNDRDSIVALLKFHSNRPGDFMPFTLTGDE